MKNKFNGLLYIILGIIGVLLVAFVLKMNTILSNKEQEEALKQVQQYVTTNYPDLSYEIQDVSPSTDFKHYGYFEYAVTVENTETKETFTVFYDKKMSRLEDSINIANQEDYANREIKTKVEKYIHEHFGETRYIDVSYDLEQGKPMILVKFNEDDKDITKSDFETFVMYIKETINLEHAIVIVDYWMRELTFNVDF